MDKIEKLPFYNYYMFLVEEKSAAEKEIAELESPEKQLERIKKFYQNLGADYTQNQWMVEKESNISEENKGEDSRINQLKRTVRIGNVVENAIEKQDEESARALNAYRSNEMYRELVEQIIFYMGVCQVKNNPEFIEKAGMVIMKRYDLSNAALFKEEGVYYYIFYLQCLKVCLNRYRNHSEYEQVKAKVSERVMNLKLMLSRYAGDPYINNEVGWILAEIVVVDALLRAGEEENNS